MKSEKNTVGRRADDPDVVIAGLATPFAKVTRHERRAAEKAVGSIAEKPEIPKAPMQAPHDEPRENFDIRM
jgi:hypothetical protein